METSDKITEVIKKTAREYLPDAEMLLFGSQARNSAYSESDYDILLITGSNFLPKDKLPIRTNIRKSLLVIGIRSDILMIFICLIKLRHFSTGIFPLKSKK